MREIFKQYREVINKQFFNIYFLYFAVFMSLGSVDALISLYFTDGGKSELYGAFLSVSTAIEIFLPIVVTQLSRRYKCRNVMTLYFAVAIAVASILYFVTNSAIIVMIFMLISFARTVFNFSESNEIIFNINDAKKANFLL